MCAENAVSVVPESVANADHSLIEVDSDESSIEENAVPAVPESITNAGFELTEIDRGELMSEEDAVSDEETRGNAFITMAAEMMRRSLAKQGITVPAFSAD